jgi:hypothetical protein
VRSHTILPPADLRAFSPRPPRAELRARYGVPEGQRVLVYPGGLNHITKDVIETLCRAVHMLNQRGYPCRLLRSGPGSLDHIGLAPELQAIVTDLGVVPREEVPDLLALADVLVQPGEPGPFDDQRLPGKLPEFLAMGKPVVLPRANLGRAMVDGVDAMLTETGAPEEIADKCIALFDHPQQARALSERARRIAETLFDPRAQAGALLAVYGRAVESFDPQLARELWSGADPQGPVAALLARRLRLLARTPHVPEPRALLQGWAAHVEASVARQQAQESALAAGRQTLAPVQEQAAQLRNALQNQQAEVAWMRATFDDAKRRDETLRQLAAEFKEVRTQLAAAESTRDETLRQLSAQVHETRLHAAEAQRASGEALRQLSAQVHEMHLHLAHAQRTRKRVAIAAAAAVLGLLAALFLKFA